MKTDNPYDPFRVDIYKIYGRKQILFDISEDLSAGRNCALVGGRRIGKTTILRKIERDLENELSRSITNGIALFPIYVDVLSIQNPSPVTIYRTLLDKIVRQLLSYGLLREQRKHDLGLLGEHKGEESRLFREILYDWIAEVSHKIALRLAIIFDEIGLITQFDWASGFFSNWRYLLNNAPELSPSVCALFAGANEMSALSQDVGSPLANVLIWRGLEPISWQASRHLMTEPCGGRFSIRLLRQIFVATGGHPFLIQFLMQKVYDDSNTEFEAFETAKREFLATQSTQFQNWAATLDPKGREVYAFLAARSHRQHKRELVRLVGDSAANQALSVLSHTGVIVKTPAAEAYRVSGTLFRDWFVGHLSCDIAPSGLDPRIYEKLAQLDPVLATKYLTSWSIHQLPLRNYSGCVSEMRDVVTLLLHKLAPDAEVEAESEYVPEKDEKGEPRTHPTRKQRVRFIRNRNKVGKAQNLNDEIDFLENLTDQLMRLVGKAYEHASARTHTVATDEQAWRCLKQLDSVLAQLL